MKEETEEKDTPEMIIKSNVDSAQISQFGEKIGAHKEDPEHQPSQEQIKDTVAFRDTLRVSKREEKLRAKAGPLHLSIPEENRQLHSLLTSEVSVCHNPCKSMQSKERPQFNYYNNSWNPFGRRYSPVNNEFLLRGSPTPFSFDWRNYGQQMISLLLRFQTPHEEIDLSARDRLFQSVSSICVSFFILQFMLSNQSIGNDSAKWILNPSPIIPGTDQFQPDNMSGISPATVFRSMNTPNEVEQISSKFGQK